MNKALRERIYNKYNGHCAYCGTPLPITEMQVDHLQPKWHNLSYEECRKRGLVRGTDEESNLMPSCRACNYYKHTSTIEGFRARLNMLLTNAMGTFDAKLALKYQMIKLQVWDGKFYFEKFKETSEDSSSQDSTSITGELKQSEISKEDNSSERKPKFEPGDFVYFMHNNKLYYKHIASRLVPYDDSDILYKILNVGTFTEKQLFKTREELLESL